MNQEIQQNITENKKPRMYVSWRVTLIYLLAIFIVVTIGEVTNFSWIEEYKEIATGVGASFSFFVVGEIFILVASVTKKPIGFVRTGLVNSIALSPLLVTPVVFFWLSFLFVGIDHIGLPFLRFIFPELLFFIFVFFTNRKFQKPEIELGLAQS